MPSPYVRGACPGAGGRPEIRRGDQVFQLVVTELIDEVLHPLGLGCAGQYPGQQVGEEQLVAGTSPRRVAVTCPGDCRRDAKGMLVPCRYTRPVGLAGREAEPVRQVAARAAGVSRAEGGVAVRT